MLTACHQKWCYCTINPLASSELTLEGGLCSCDVRPKDKLSHLEHRRRLCQPLRGQMASAIAGKHLAFSPRPPMDPVISAMPGVGEEISTLPDRKICGPSGVGCPLGGEMSPQAQ